MPKAVVDPTDAPSSSKAASELPPRRQQRAKGKKREAPAQGASEVKGVHRGAPRGAHLGCVPGGDLHAARAHGLRRPVSAC